MVYFVDATSSPASFVITLAALTPVQGVTWTYNGLPTITNSGIKFTTSDDSGITFTATPGFVNNLTNMTVRATLDDATTAAATFNISSGSGATLPAINPLAVLSVMDGLAAWYDGPSWDATTVNKFWRDKSGNVRNTSPSDVRGTITYDSTNGFLYGGVGDGVKLPDLGTTANYTVIHLAKYNNGVKKRIFQGVTNDWASGFYAGKAGVAYHNGYITAPTDLYGYNWVISSDQRSLYRAHSIDFTAGTPGTPGYPDRIGLNFGAATTEYSDWAVAEVLIYNRVLTATEMLSIENYLRTKYPSLTIQIDTTTGASFTIPQANRTASVGTVNWTYKTPLPTGVSFSGSTQGGATFSIATGTYLNNQNLVVTASGNGGGGSRSIYLLSASRALLNAPNVTFNSGVAGSFTILQTASGTGGVTWAYSNLPASVTFLSQSDAGLTFTVAQNAVVPTRTITVTATNGLGTPTVASFTYGSGVKPVLAVGTVTAIDSTTQQTFFVPQTVVDALTGGITWSYSPTVDKFPTGLTVSATNQGATFTVAQNAVIAPQTITVTATNVGGVATPISFTVGAAVKPVLTFSNQLLDTSTALKQFTVTVQAPSVTYSGGITWSYVLPTGLTFVTSTSGLITFQAARSVVIASQTFAVTATNGVGTQTVASFTLGAGTPPTLSDPANGTGELILDTTSINRTFTIEQQSRNTGTISWTITPSSYPTGVSIQSTTDFGVTFLLLQGSVLPYQPFTFRAMATSGFTVTRSFKLGGGTIVDLAGPGDPQLLDTTTQQTVQVSQRNDPAYTGTIVWTITPETYPSGISITTQDDSKTIFTFNANSYLLRQQFVFTARAVSGLTSTVRFDIGAAVRPTLSTLTDRVLDTSTALKTFSVTQQVNTAYTGPITWIVTPNPFPTGSGMSQATTDGLITFTVPAQTSTTGVVWPNTPFSVTAKNTNTGYSSAPTTFNVFAPRLPVLNAISSSIVDVSTTAYTVTASQSKTDAVPVVWTITKGDGSAVPSGVSINSSTGLITVAATTYFTATILKPIATNSAGASGSTTFTLTTPEPPAISTTPTSPQILNVTAVQQQLTFTLTNSSLAGTVTWSFGTFVPPTGVTITTGGVLTIPKDTYFASTVFTIRATNTNTTVFRERTITINTPQTPVISTVTPTTRQVFDVTTGSKTFSFTNTVTLAAPVVWSLTTNPQSSAVTIDSGTGLVTLAANQYFLESNFVVQASNAAISVTNTRSFYLNAPAPPIISATSASPQVLNTTVSAQTLTFTNTDARAAPVVWGVTGAPSGVTMASGTGILTIPVQTTTPAFVGTNFTITASNAAISYTTSLTPYTVSAPAIPVLSATVTSPTTKAVVVVGGVSAVQTGSGSTIAGQANQTYTSVASTATTGVGAGATFTITRNASGAIIPANISPAYYGSGYVTGNTVKILGTLVGGATPANDVTVTVTAGQTVYMNNATSNAVVVSQGATNTGTIAWGGVTGLPTGVNITDTPATNSALTVTVTSSAVLRPKPSTNLSLSVTAVGPSPPLLTSAAVPFDIFTPLTPVIGATTPTDGTNVLLDTSTSSKTVSIVQDSTSTTLTGPLIWNFLTPTRAIINSSGIGIVDTPRSVTLTVPQGTYGIYNTSGSSPYYLPVQVQAINLANMISVTRSFNVYVPYPPTWSYSGTLTFDSTTTGTKTITVKQSVSTLTNYSGISYAAVTGSPSTFVSGIAVGAVVPAASGDTYTVSILQNTSTGDTGQTLTFSATNGASLTVPYSIKIVCGGPPVISATSTWTPVPATGLTDTYQINTSAASTINVKYTSDLSVSGVSTSVAAAPITAFTNTTGTITIAKWASITADTAITLTVVSPAKTVTFAFKIGAAVAPSLSISPATPMSLDTTSSQTITITAATSPPSIVTGWSISPALPSGVTGSGVTGDTSGGTVVYTITIPKTTTIAATDYTVTALTGVGTIQTSTTFSLTAAVKPVVNSIGTQSIDTTSNATGPTATVTSPTAMSTITWTISGGSGVSIDSSTGVISVSASSLNNGVTITVTATNAVGSGNTTFTLNSAIKPVINTLSIADWETSSSLTTTATMSSGSTPVTWSLSGQPSPVSINPSTGVFSSTINSLWTSGSFTLNATVNGIVGSTTVPIGRGYKRFTSTTSGFSFATSQTTSILIVGGGGNGGRGGGTPNVDGGGGGGGGGAGSIQSAYIASNFVLNITVGGVKAASSVSFGSTNLIAAAGSDGAPPSYYGNPPYYGYTGGIGGNAGTGGGKGGNGGSNGYGQKPAAYPGKVGADGTSTVFGYFGGGGGGGDSFGNTSAAGGLGGGGSGGKATGVGTSTAGSIGSTNTGGGGGGGGGDVYGGSLGGAGASGVVYFYI